MEHPLPVEQLPAPVVKVCGPSAPPPLKAMAASGLAPLGPTDLLTVLYVFIYDKEHKLEQKATASLDKLPDKVLLGALEQQTRMARVLVSVDDPLNYRAHQTDLPPLIIGAFVGVQIQAGELRDVIRLKREYIRKDDTVWVMKADRLDIRPVQIAFRDENHAFVEGGLSEADQVVTTNLSTVVNGAKLRVNTVLAPERPHAGMIKDAGPQVDERPLGGSH